MHPEPFGGPAASESEAGDDLIEQQERAGVVARLPHALEEPGAGSDQAHVRGDGLDGHDGDGLVDLGHDVERGHDGVGDRRCRHAVASGQALVGDAGTTRGQERIGVTVVAAGELDDRVAPGGAARQSDRRHRRLGTRRSEPEHLQSGDTATELLGEDDLGLGRCAIARSPGRGGGDCGRHCRVGVTEDARPIALHVVDVAIALDVPDIRAFGPLHEIRRAPHRAE